MSLQLIVFPQSYNGLNSLSGAGAEVVVDGINFNTLDLSTSSTSLAGTLPQSYITATSFFVNTWYRFSDNAGAVSEVSGSAIFIAGQGIVQKLSNLVVGADYDCIINFNSNAGGFRLYQYVGTIQQTVAMVVSGTTGAQTITFTAQSINDTLAFYSTGATSIASISVKRKATSTSNTDLNTGQVIMDLYEFEDIPLTLSVDDFKNAAEQVKSYSKAFNLPGTKRNNQIFDNVFEITRTDDGIVFNPYVKTQCILNQDGFTIFEGFLRLIDVQEKEGERSYNINLYSEVVALADVLEERTFEDLGFQELAHDYGKANIKASWIGSVTYTNAATSGFRDANTLKYPFVDWTHQILIANGSTGTTAAAGLPELTKLEQAFRPFIQLKYLINRIFNQPAFDFTYTSNFFDTNADFAKLYMDFNWGDEPYGSAPLRNDFVNRQSALTNIDITQYPQWLNIPVSLAGSPAGNTALWNNTSYFFSSDVNNLEVTADYRIQLENTSSTNDWTTDMRVVKRNGAGIILEVFDSSSGLIARSGSGSLSGSFGTTLNANENLCLQATTFNSSNDISTSNGTTSFFNITYNNTGTSTDSLLATSRGELGQWEFLKGIFTMFNLVSVPDKSDPNNIIIEPYNDMFLENADSSELNWTEKIDIEEIKLTPLTNLKRKTIFKFVEDDDDFPFQNYKNQVEGHLYGSKKWDASTSQSGLETILAGDEEIIPEPFAATLVKPLMTQYQWLTTPAIYSYDPDEGTSKGFKNSPRIMFSNGLVDLLNTGNTYFIPAQNGEFSEDATRYLQFSHLSSIPTVTTTPPIPSNTRDFHFGECQLLPPVGAPTFNNLFNMYWLPYFNELYNPDTRIMTIKVNLSPGDINTFKFYDVVMIKNRKFRINKIDYKPHDLSTVEFILII
tara:strand:- start:2363 stop:5065 length:2703 start_codon:yes stop_codon:yes gene_type:complete